MGTPAAVRFPRAAPRPASIEQYEQLMQRQAQLQARNVAMEQAAAASAGRLPLVQPPKQSPVITTVKHIPKVFLLANKNFTF